MTSEEMRSNPLFMRNGFIGNGRFNIPVIKKQLIDLSKIELIACSDTRINDNKINRQKGVHFFVDDYRFTATYNKPESSLAKYSQYKFLLSPDFSVYSNMKLWRQFISVAQNRWVGAYWQSKGLIVIATVSWGNFLSFDFCFDGIEENAIVAVSTLGCKNAKIAFMRGYNVMLEKINPEAIICFDKPFPEMEGNIIVVDYLESRKVMR